METPSVQPVTAGTCHPSTRLLALEQVTPREAAYLGRVPGVDVALDEVATGFGETIYVDPVTGASL